MWQADLTSGKVSQKKVWSLIANEINKHGHCLTRPQCLSKFSGLKRTYKSIKDHNGKSGNSTRTWLYFTVSNNFKIMWYKNMYYLSLVLIGSFSSLWMSYSVQNRLCRQQQQYHPLGKEHLMISAVRLRY